MFVKTTSQPLKGSAGIVGAVPLQQPAGGFLQEEDARDENNAGYVLESEGEAPFIDR